MKKSPGFLLIKDTDYIFSDCPTHDSDIFDVDSKLDLIMLLI